MAFAVKADLRACFSTLTNGGGISPRRACAWCINCPSPGICAAILYHNHKGGWQNFLGVSAVQSSAVMEIWEL